MFITNAEIFELKVLNFLTKVSLGKSYLDGYTSIIKELIVSV